ncbi:MAG: TrkH family potassium uptake protein [Actinomycetota bacterium]|nr:TrkH family potassium uptake protein [Actinomycetota bacterium]
MAITVARMRRAMRREVLGVDVGGALNLVGAIVRYLSLAFLLPVAIAIGYGDPAWPFLVAAALTAAFGWTLTLVTHGRETVGAREGFLVVSLTWVLGAFFISLPYLFAEPQLRDPVDAYFEAMSGMTTTGASVLTDIEALDRSMAMWRQFSQWLGGMGIIVLALAVLPRLRIGGRQLMEFEAPGPELEPLSVRIRDTARRLWFLYVGFTLLLILVLSLVGWSGLDERMTFYDAVAHAFTTLPTGGFSPRARSLEEFAAVSQWVIVVFMMIAGANFVLMYRALVRREPRVLVRDEELRLYVGLLAVGAIILFLDLASEGIATGEAGIRQAVFEAVATMTTTGYAVTDYAANWTALGFMVLVFLMFVGGSAGSTGGAIKVVRILLLGRILGRELDQTVHREAVLPLRFNRRIVEERTVRAVGVFVLLYVVVFALGALVIGIDSGRADVGVRPFDAVAAAATTIGNVGPALGFAGPMGSFQPFSDLSKGVMIVLMWMGRLELIPVVVLFTKSYWRA